MGRKGTTSLKHQGQRLQMGDGLARSQFTFLDVLRILSGLILLNALLSYTFTSSTMWGYDGRYVNTTYLRHVLRGYPQTRFTPESLLEATQKTGRLLLSIDKKVFDVSSNPEMYDPQSVSARYSTFVGQDCTRMFVNGCFNETSQCTWDLRNMGFEEDWVTQRVESWLKFYTENPHYWQVGYLDVGELETHDIPEQCLTGVSFPF